MIFQLRYWAIRYLLFFMFELIKYRKEKPVVLKYCVWSGASVFELGQMRKKPLNGTSVLIMELLCSQCACIFSRRSRLVVLVHQQHLSNLISQDPSRRRKVASKIISWLLNESFHPGVCHGLPLNKSILTIKHESGSWTLQVQQRLFCCLQKQAGESSAHQS